jgi:hypothetical protein
MFGIDVQILDILGTGGSDQPDQGRKYSEFTHND